MTYLNLPKKEQSAVYRLLFSFTLTVVPFILWGQDLTNAQLAGCATRWFKSPDLNPIPRSSPDDYAGLETSKYRFQVWRLKISPSPIKESIREITVGYSIIHEKLPEGYDYTPLFVTARFPLYQFPSKKKSVLSIFTEPQFVWNNAPASFPTTYEFGVNVGVKYLMPFSKKNGFTAAIGAGPHYLSLETNLQAKGFIFSDNFEIGYYQSVNEKWGWTIKTRFRHLSNAGFQSPNIGIDNFFLMMGVFWDK